MEDKLLEIVKKLDEILDENNLHHGSVCKTIWDTSYYECKCGLKALHKLQLEHIEPLLKELKEE